MAVKTFAAIDIGSYYVNMEIFELSPKGGVRSLTRVRQNLETGRDTYVLHKITMDRLNELTAILKDYRRIMREFGVSDFRACAKSAFREADNRFLVVDHIYQATGIYVDVLSNSEQRFLGYKSIASRGRNSRISLPRGRRSSMWAVEASRSPSLRRIPSSPRRISCSAPSGSVNGSALSTGRPSIMTCLWTS